MLVQHLMGGSRQIGMLGTVRYDLGGRTLPSFKTTPESVDTFALLDQMRGAGCAEAVLEVSSHGLDQKRVYGMAVEVAVFMNLTRDHIDYHESMEAYFQSKLTLFNGKNGSLPRAAVINLDCPYGQRLEKSLDRAVTAITFSLEGEADFVARKLKLYPDYTEFELDGPSGLIKVKSPLLGRYNVSNLLAALAVGHAQGFKLEDQLARLADFQAVPGRMERIDLKQSFNVLVDYAHTDDALTHACGMLRELTKGRCILVFGCGGDRDRSKRAPMLRAALSHADIILVTADNPRSEAQEQIFEDMRVALKEGSEDRVQFIPDRKRAISMALDLAQADDCVLVAGKGHETYQEFDGSVIPFDDRQMIRELWALKEKGSSAK
jgi:UDP-N-acetylmuramoyl-L-alanyl-D-glutamate--2,6-diaminopimelate ligase